MARRALDVGVIGRGAERLMVRVMTGLARGAGLS